MMAPDHRAIFPRRNHLRPSSTIFDRLRLAALLALAAACNDSSGPGETSERGFKMGFSPFPPSNNQTLALQALDLWSTRADAAILHLGVPWAGLLQGFTADQALEQNGVGLANYFRAKGLSLTVMIDVTDGLNRAAEAPELVALGRSITEPAVQQLYRDYAVAVARRLRPEFLGLAAETNLIRLAAPALVYQAIVTMTNAAAVEVKAAEPTVRLYVSVQVESAWGGLQGTGQFIGVDQDFQDFPFLELLGLSSYPYLGGWTDPAQLPDDYYTRLRGNRSVPLLVVEGGWASESAPGFTSSPALQAAYFRRQAQLAEQSGLLRWFQLTFTDLDLEGFPELPPVAVLFARLGLVDAELRPKPALAVWDSVFAR
jgi:hypothetical protein